MAGARIVATIAEVETGEEIEVLEDNGPKVTPVPPLRPRWLPAAEIGLDLMRHGADATGLVGELRETLLESTDDLAAHDAMPDVRVIKI